MSYRAYQNDRRRPAPPRNPMIGLMLLNQLYRIIEPLPVKPLATIAIIAMNMACHYCQNELYFYFSIDLNIQRNCLLPQTIVDTIASSSPSNSISSWVSKLTGRESASYVVNRLLLSALIHVDDWHLYYNMTSLAYKGVNLEALLGFEAFLYLLCYSWICSHVLAVFLSYALYHTYFIHSLPELTTSYRSCGVGFSAVIFALKYVWNYHSSRNGNTHEAVYGIRLPLQYVCWVELILISMLHANVSFIGRSASYHFSLCID